MTPDDYRADYHASGVRALLTTGIDADQGNFGSTTPLSFRAEERWTPRRFAYTPRSPEADEAVVRAFLESGTNPNVIVSQDGGVAKLILPLLWAARRDGTGRTGTSPRSWPSP